MALSDRDIIITPNRGSATEPNILFRGADASNSGTITLTVLNTGSTAILRWSGSAGNLVSITNTSGTALNVLSTTQATSTLTGALQVAGGVGIQGNLWVGGTINGTIAGAGSATTATNLAGGTANQIPVQTAPNTTGFIVAPTVANTVLTWNGSAFTYALPASTFNGGTITNPLFINNATPTSSTSTGAFVVLGGVGIGGGLVVGNITTVTNTTNASSTATGALQVRGGAGIGGELFVGSTASVRTSLYIGENTSTTYVGGYTKSLVLDGGAGGVGGLAGFEIRGGNLSGLGVQSVVNFLARTSAGTTVNSARIEVTNSAGATNVGIMRLYTRSSSALIEALRIDDSQVVSILSAAASTSTTTGALVVTGGVGIGGNLNVGGTLTVNGTPVTPVASLFIEIIATAAQTTFTIPGGYTPPYIQVFANGVLLSTANYTASNGTTVVVNNARNAGDVMRFIAGSNVLGFTTATFATNMLGGAANQILFQTGPNATSFITAPVTTNTVLTWNGSAFTWAVASGGGGTATGSAGVNTVSSATNATRYLTFVDNNYGVATTSSVYTDAGISYNPSTNDLTITGGLSSGGAANLATGGVGNVLLAGSAGSRMIVNTGGAGVKIVSEGANPLSLYAGTVDIGGLTINNAGGVVTINTNSNASSAATGALRVVGGAGIGGNLYVGGTIFQNGFAISTGSGITAVGSAGVTTLSSATNATRYLTFVDNNHGSATTSSVYTDAGISYNPSTNDLTITGTFIQTPATLGSTLGNTSFYQSLRGSNGNSNLLEIFMIRDAAGADWTTAGTRIQQKIDSTWMAYEQFNGASVNGGIEWGSGLTTTSPQAIAPRMRLTSAGVFNVLTTTNASSTTTGALVVSGGAGIGGNLYVGGTIFQNGVAVGSGGAGGAGGVNTVSSATNATRYLTFVDNNFGSATTSSVYTDAGIIYNPSTNDLTVSNVLNSGGVANLATGGSGDVVLMGATTNRVIVTAGGVNKNIRSETGDFNVRAASDSAGGLTVAAANGSVTINPNTNATSTGTGALVVRGGIGANGNIYTSGNLYLENLNAELVLGNSVLGTTGLKTLVLNRTSTGDTAVIKAGNQTLFGGNTILDIFNNSAGSNFDLRSYSNAGFGPTAQGIRLRIEGSKGDVQILNDTQAVSTTTGALQVRGGLGVGGNIHFSGNLYQNGQLFTQGTGDPIVFNDISTKFDGLESVFTLKDGYYSTGTVETFSAGVDWTPVTLPRNGGGGAPPPSTTLLGTTLGAGSFVVPVNVVAMTLEAWGGGGGSSGLDRGSTSTAAGGAYASSVVTVTPGQTVFYSIGAGGTGGSTSGSAGTQSWINVGTNAVPGSSTVGVRAAGGAGSGVAFPNNSTQAANSVGTIINIGGSGPQQIDDGLGGGTGPTLFAFTTFTFNSASTVGRFGPTFATLQSAYTAQPWSSNSSYFFQGRAQGYQTWQVPVDGTYEIEVAGARGQNSASSPGNYGRGAIIRARVFLTIANKLEMVVGQVPGNSGSSNPGNGYAGAGGGSFVVLHGTNTPVIIAGGGGGSYSTYPNQAIVDGQTRRQPRWDGFNWSPASLGSDPVIGEGAPGFHGGGGGGLLTAGKDYPGQTGSSSMSTGAGGQNFTHGAAFIGGAVSNGGGNFFAIGGNATALTSEGGFGGGGGGHSGNNTGGGGGGYSGGLGGQTSLGGSIQTGMGGGSFIQSGATNVATSDGQYDGSSTFGGSGITNISSFNDASGYIKITKI